jgi:hypothetical protein
MSTASTKRRAAATPATGSKLNMAPNPACWTFAIACPGCDFKLLPAQPVDATQAFSAGFFANPVDSATSSL